MPKLEIANLNLQKCGMTEWKELYYNLSYEELYKHETDADQHLALGAIILYIAENYCGKLIRKLEYPLFTDDDDPEYQLDACGTLCNLIAGNFKNGLTQLGYKELYMSYYSTYENEVINGVEFDPTQTICYEINFEINGERRLVIDYTTGLVPRLSDL